MVQYSLFAKELRENRVKFFLLMASLTALGLLIPLFFEQVRTILEQPDLSRFVGPQDLAFITASYGNYAWSQWNAKNLTQLATVAAVVFGAGALSGERHYGTALFLTSRPVTRREIYTTKAAAGLFLLAVCLFGSTLVLLLVSALKGYRLDYGAFLTAALITFACAAVVYLGTAALSAVLPDPAKTAVVAALGWLLLSIPGYFGLPAASLSIFFQMKAIPYWIYDQNPIVPLGIFLVLAAALYELGVWLWSTREL